MDKADISIALSILALLVTSVFWMRQNRLQGRITNIEEGRRDEEIEAKRHARVTAVIRWSGAAPHLVLRNHGPAEARSVGFTVAAGSKGNIPAVADTELLPLSVLHPDVPMPFPLGEDPEDCSVVLVTVTWTDDAGPHEKDFKLRVFY